MIEENSGKDFAFFGLLISPLLSSLPIRHLPSGG